MGGIKGSDPNLNLLGLFISEVKFLTEEQKVALQQCSASDIPIEVS